MIRDFHPLVFFYVARLPDDARSASASASPRSCCGSWATTITPATIVLVALLLISGSQFTLFAMWFDMESNKDAGGRGRHGTDQTGSVPETA